MGGPIQHLRLARSYLANGRHMEALVVAKKGAEAFPDFSVEFALLLSDVQLARGDRARARSILEVALLTHPEDQRLKDARRALDS